MRTLTDKYVNPFTDFGFKRLFGEEVNKNLLQDFLNELLREEQGEIVALEYLKNEQLGNNELDRRAVFDLYCTNERGEKFIVELQKTKQKFFKDRALYYATFPIREQAKKGNWDYRLKPVYLIGILDFSFDDSDGAPDKFRYDIKLTDVETQQVFHDKLTFIYLEMPKFNKSLDDLENKFEQWLYLLKHLKNFQQRPAKLQEKVFEQAFKTAEIAQFTPTEYQAYEDSLKYYRDMKNSLDTAREEGREEGREQEKTTIAKDMKADGLPIDTIVKYTGLSKDDIEKL